MKQKITALLLMLISPLLGFGYISKEVEVISLISAQASTRIADESIAEQELLLVNE